MRRGCIAITEVSCNGCKRVILHGERYLASDEEDAVNRLCLDCCLKKGLAGYQKERGQEYLTMFAEKLAAVPEFEVRVAAKGDAKPEGKKREKVAKASAGSAVVKSDAT